MDYLLGYLKRHNVPEQIVTSWHRNVSIIVVIPCYDEPNIENTIRSLLKCSTVDTNILVIILVNSGESTSKDIIRQNRLTYNRILGYYPFSENNHLNFYPLLVEEIRTKHMGAGYARKMGMDVAVATFCRVGNPDGLIVSLDADTLVKENYFVALLKVFLNKSIDGGTIHFEHQSERTNHQIDNGITLYELHLRYVNHALDFSGFPYSFYTLGSAFFIRCSEYVKHGGMNRKKGGEDFYFLHKVLPDIAWQTVTSTTVYPSSRVSDRVPFGTGLKVKHYLETGEMRTYSLKAFEQLKSFFDLKELFYVIDKDVVLQEILKLCDPVKSFLLEMDGVHKITVVKDNTSSQENFIKRFFGMFNGFFVVKFLNHSHISYFKKERVEVEARDFIQRFYQSGLPDARAMLQFFRRLDRGAEHKDNA